MATQDDVRRIALSLPETTEGADDFGFGVLNKGKLKGFVWAWNERIEPGKPRVPNPEVLVVRVAGQRAKEELLAADPDKFFTEPHYNGFPAVLVRLPAIDTDELAELITDAWRCQAPRALAAELDNPPRLGHGEAAVGTGPGRTPGRRIPNSGATSRHLTHAAMAIARYTSGVARKP